MWYMIETFWRLQTFEEYRKTPSTKNLDFKVIPEANLGIFFL